MNEQYVIALKARIFDAEEQAKNLSEFVRAVQEKLNIDSNDLREILDAIEPVPTQIED